MTSWWKLLAERDGHTGGTGSWARRYAIGEGAAEQPGRSWVAKLVHHRGALQDEGSWDKRLVDPATDVLGAPGRSLFLQGGGLVPTAAQLLLSGSAPTVEVAAGFSIAGLPSLFNRWTADTIAGNDGDLISAWDDTGSANEDGATNTTARPTLRTSIAAINNKKALQFDGNDYFPLTDYLTGAGLTEVTYVWVCAIDADPGAGGCPPFHTNNAGGGGAHYPWTDGNVYLTQGTNARKNIGNLPGLLSDWHILVIRAKANLYDVRLNGVQVFNTTTNTFMSPSTLPYIGSDGSNFFTGRLAQLIFLNAYETDEVVAQIEAELNAYYDLGNINMLPSAANLALSSIAPTVANGDTPHRYWRLNVTDNNGDTTYIAVAELELATAEFGGRQLGGTASASSEFSPPAQAASEAFDSVIHAIDFCWATAGVPTNSWLKYDFGAGNAKAIAQMTLHTQPGEIDRAPKNWALEYSDDDTNWTSWMSGTFVPTIDGQMLRAVKAGREASYSGSPYGAHQYWRVVVATTIGSAISAAEMEFRATPGGADQASGGTPSVSSTLVGTAADIFDNNNATHWAINGGQGAWIKYAFASAVEVAEVAWRIRGDSNPSHAPKSFTVQYSDDNTNWTTAWQVLDEPSWSDGEQRVFTSPHYMTT